MGFATKPRIALAQIQRLMEQGAPRHCVLDDADYGADTAFRESLSELGMSYAVGIPGSLTVWPPGHEPLPTQPYSERGRIPQQRLRLSAMLIKTRQRHCFTIQHVLGYWIPIRADSFNKN